MDYQLIVIGGGPAGYVAAIRAAQLDMKTAIIEADALGGTCLNWGCIPTKALLRSAEIYDQIKHADSFGLSVENLSYDTKKMVERSRKIANKLSQGIGFLMKKNKITVYYGKARFKTPQSLEVTGAEKSQTLSSPHIIIATGATVRHLNGMEADGKHIWTAREAMIPEKMPNSLLVIGSGAIGIEFASFYRSFGVETTVLEVMERILPAEDAEIAALAHKRFEKRGIRILTGVKTEKCTKKDNGISLEIAHKDGKKEIVQADKMIVAAGVIPNIDGLDLDMIGILDNKGNITIDEWGVTKQKGVYAVGDVAGAPMLAHKASHEAIACVERIAGLESAHPLDKSKIPGCTYCEPQIASIGLSEEKAKQAGHALKIGRFPFAGNGKAIALGAEDGLIKTIFDVKSGELLGAHMIGSEVTELIQGFSIAMTLETTEAELMRTVFPHPTLSEMMHESVLSAYDSAIHI